MPDPKPETAPTMTGYMQMFGRLKTKEEEELETPESEEKLKSKQVPRPAAPPTGVIGIKGK